jgi:hypothetical protein
MASKTVKAGPVAGTDLRKSDLLAGWIVSESKPPLINLQAVSLTRRCAISVAMAAVVSRRSCSGRVDDE